MAWIESNQELWRHPKTKKLARILDVSVPTAIGHLHGLWYWALDFAQSGDISRYDAEDIADAVMWEGESGQLLDGFIQAGFIDKEKQAMRIHDWMDYAGRLIERRAADRERKANSRRGSKKDAGSPEAEALYSGEMQDVSRGSPQDVQRTHDGQPEESERNPSLSL